MIEGKDREETIDLTVRLTGMSRDEAEFIAALEAGEIDGDDILIDENGNEIRQPADQVVEPDLTLGGITNG